MRIVSISPFFNGLDMLRITFRQIKSESDYILSFLVQVLYGHGLKIISHQGLETSTTVHGFRKNMDNLYLRLNRISFFEIFTL